MKIKMAKLLEVMGDATNDLGIMLLMGGKVLTIALETINGSASVKWSIKY